MDHINQHATMNTNFSEKAFDAILNNIKLENDSLFNDESSDSEDSANIAYKSIDNKSTKQQDEMYGLASTSFEKNANDESNMQEHTNTELVDGKVINMHESSATTALPIMEVMPIFTPYTCRQCFCCKKNIRFVDRPSRIGEIQSIYKQNEYLKIEPLLTVNSYLCAFCWEFLEKGKKNRVFSEHWSTNNISNNKTLTRKCSIHFCSQPCFHKMSVDQCELAKKIISTFEYCGLVFVKSTNKSSDFLTYPFCLCKFHNTLIFTMLTCQICNSKLNEPLNIDDWLMYQEWNMVLVKDNLPLMLQPGMFICMTCKTYVSKINPGFPSNDLVCLRRNIFLNYKSRLKLYGQSQYKFNIYQRLTNVASPIVVAKIKNENDYVRSTKVKFSNPLTTATYHYVYDYDINDKELKTSSALLNVGKQNLHTPKLEPIDEGLSFEKLEEQHLKTSTPSNYVPGHGGNKDLLQLYGDHQLKKYDTKIFKNKEINQYPEIVHHNSLKNQCQVDNVEIVKNELEIIDSRQVFSVHNETENNQSWLNSHIISSGAQYKTSAKLKEFLNKINSIHKTINLNEPNSKMYSCIVAVEPPNVVVNPVSIKRKQNNVICHSISNKDVKKQRLNKKYSSRNNNPKMYHTTKSYQNKNDMNEELLKIHSNSMKDIEIKTNVPPIEIQKTYGSNLSCSNSPLQFKCELKKISSFCKPEESSIKSVNTVLLDKDISDSESIPETIILSDSENLLDFEIRVSDTDDPLDTEIFSDTDNEEILSNFDVEETDFMIVVSEEDLNSDSDCEIITVPQIDTDYKFVSDSEDSLDVEIISNDKNLIECTTLLDDEKDSNCKITSDGIKESECIIVSDTGEKFSNKKLSTFKVIKTGSCSEILMNHAKIIETYFKNENGKVNYIVAFENEIKPSGDKVSTCIVISDNTTGFDNKKLSTYKINVDNGSDCKIFLDGEKVKIVSEKKNKNVIVFNDEIENSDKKSKCIIISDNEKEYTNKNISTFKIVSNVQRSPACEILNGKEIFGIESGNRKIRYMIMSDDEIESNSDDQSQCMISDDRKEFDTKKLSASKIVKTNVQKGSDSVLLNGEESHEILLNSENGRLKCMIAPDCEIESDSDEQSDNEEIFSYKKVSDIIITSNGTIEVDDSQGEQTVNEEEFNAKKISDIIITSNNTVQVDDTQSLKTLDDNNSINNSKINSDIRSSQLQIKSGHSFPSLELTANENKEHDAENSNKLSDYFKPYLLAIEYFFENSDNPLLKELYIRLGNNPMDMLLYLMENVRMFYFGNLYISNTADEFSKKYLMEQKEILFNYFGDPNDSVNASKPFIHPSSHLHKYSKRLSPDIGPLIIKDITITTSSPVQNNSIASKVQNQFLKHSNPNIRFPVAIKRKTVSKNKLKNSQLQ